MPFSIYSLHIVTGQIKPKIGRRHFLLFTLLSSFAHPSANGLGLNQWPVSTVLQRLVW